MDYSKLDTNIDYIIGSDEELTSETLTDFIKKHQAHVDTIFRSFDRAYRGLYDIFTQQKKAQYKPDNRIAVNFAKYITDTFNGFFIGNPIKITTDEKSVDDYVSFVNAYNNIESADFEIAKMMSIFGKAYEMYYIDNNGKIAIAQFTPLNAFMIYDDSLLKRPRYFVYTYQDKDKHVHGSISDNRVVKWFDMSNGFKWESEEKPHGFGYVPAYEWVENKEKMCIFQSALPAINEFNKALSEKANDVDYFADAYLKILGTELDETKLNTLRDNRIINFEGEDADKLIVDFLQKPNADNIQENLLNRLNTLIFQQSMVANISDENFGASSGVALKYKLLAMSNLAKNKENQFRAGLDNRYKIIFSNAINSIGADDWTKLRYTFSPNIPNNETEEAQIAGALAGITSKRTQLSVLSVVDNVEDEIKRIEEEQNNTGYMPDYPTARTAEADDGDEQ